MPFLEVVLLVSLELGRRSSLVPEPLTGELCTCLCEFASSSMALLLRLALSTFLSRKRSCNRLELAAAPISLLRML